MATKQLVTKIAEFELIHLGSPFTNEPNDRIVIALLEWRGKVMAMRRGLDRNAVLLGKFYNNTFEGMYLLRHIRGVVKFEQLDGATIQYQRRSGTANTMSGYSIWTTIWFKDGSTKQFRD